MQIEVTETVQQTRVIDIDFPYYYQHVMDNFNNDIYFGKIEETKVSVIHYQQKEYNETVYELEQREFGQFKNSGLIPYLNDEHKSSKLVYEAIKQKALEFLTNL